MVQVIDHTVPNSFLCSLTDPAVLDQSVEDVLGLMLGVPVSVLDEPVTPVSGPLNVTAVVGLAGALSGAFTVLAQAQSAMQMTACLMGSEISTFDDTVFDGVGEVTNMLAGAWKSNIPTLNSACLLSVPTVVTGTQYEVHKRNSAFRLTRTYGFSSHCFTVTIYGENP
jgi:chemotaxis protein CheX